MRIGLSLRKATGFGSEQQLLANIVNEFEHRTQRYYQHINNKTTTAYNILARHSPLVDIEKKIIREYKY